MNRLTYDDLQAMLLSAQQRVPVGTVWRHYNGTQYSVMNIAVLEATDEPAVVYASVEHPDVLFVRTVSSWLEPVKMDAKTSPRFVRVEG